MAHRDIQMSAMLVEELVVLVVAALAHVDALDVAVRDAR
jgi:hypothetical protein